MTEEAWLRQPKESPRAHAALQIYLEMGPTRSLVKTNTLMGRDPSSVNGLKIWSSRYAWVERARAWDNKQATDRRTLFEQETKDAQLRWIKQATAVQGGFSTLLRELAARLDSGDLDLKDLKDSALLGTIAEFSKPWRQSIAVERLARGLETEHVRHEGIPATAPIIIEKVDVRTIRSTATKAEPE